MANTTKAMYLVFTVVVGFMQPATANAEPAPGGTVVTLQDLLSAPVPALCQHDPGNLVNGILPPQDSHPGQVMIAKRNDQPDTPYKVAFGSLTGGHIIDAAMVTDCSAGGVPGSETIQLYTAGPTRLGGMNLGDITHSREVVTDLSIIDGLVHVNWLANAPGDAECCPSIIWPATCVGTASRASIENVRRLN